MTTDGSDHAELNPTQRTTLDALGAGIDAHDRPETPDDLAPRLRSELEAGLAVIVDSLSDTRQLIIAKHLLNGVHGCQARYVDGESREFIPSVPVVRGTIAHKALELAVHWPRTPIPLELVDDAIGRVTDSGNWASDWMISASTAELAELRSEAGDIVAKFLECWPPITAAMRPTTESKLYTELCGGRIVLKGQVDLTLGQPIASGNRARKIIVDYKTGGYSPEHRSDLRFYALVETLRLGVPPRLLVTSYLGAGTLDIEEVTVDMLDATVARVIDGITTFIALRAGEIDPVRRPSTACRWCPLADDCAPGQAFLEDSDIFA